MKCSQKLCQRTKNISPSGNCNVCENVIDELTKKHEETFPKKRKFEKVELDLNMMIDIHKKLVNGSQIEPKTVNALLLSGIINILNQSEAFEEIEAISKDLEHQNVTNKARIEALENWVLKQNDAIVDLSEKLSCLDENGFIIKESSDVLTLKKRIGSIEIDLNSLKRTSMKRNESSKPLDSNKRSKKCNECDNRFTQNFEMENHMVEAHQRKKQHVCEVCEKEFYFEWRLKKHTKMHTEVPNFCYYFTKKKACPFEEIGCKFRHEFQHVELAHEQEVAVEEAQESSEKIADKPAAAEKPNDESSNHEIASDTIDENDTIKEYECHLCNSIHPSKLSREECCDHQHCSVLECYSHRAVFKFS